MTAEVHNGGTVIDAQNPWPGLSAFDEAAERYFNGRDAESAELVRLVGQGPFAVLFGKSGLGKTSLLQAGLFPRLRRQSILPIYVRLDVRDRAAPLIDQAAAALLAEIRKNSIDASGTNQSETLWEHLHGREVEWWSPRNQPLTPLFVFDQFEEVLTLGAANARAVERLWLDLADLIENRLPAALADGIAAGGSIEHLDLRAQRYKVLLSFREDFLADIEGHKHELPSLMRNRLRLSPMSADQALRVVSGDTAAGRVHALFDDGTARAVVHFVAAVQAQDAGTTLRRGAGQPLDHSWAALEIEPALLSLVCAGLNRRRQASGRGTQAATINAGLLAETGGSIIADFYHGCVADVPERTRRFIEDSLITEGGFRNSYPLQDALEQALLTEPLLRRLVDRRLLRIDHQLGMERVELIHDRLTDVVREHRNRLRAEREQRRQRRRALASSGLAALGVIIAVVLWYFLREARHERATAERAFTNATALKLAIEGRTILAGTKPGGPELGVKLTLAAFRLAPSPETLGAVQTAENVTAAVLWIRGAYGALAFSSDGGRIASGGSDGILRLWDAATGALVGKPVRGHAGAINCVAFSKDGLHIASGGVDKTLRIWDAATGAPLGGPLEAHAAVVDVAFNPDGKTIVSAGDDKTLRRWDIATGVARPLTGAPGAFTSFAFSPDGSRFASVDRGGTLRVGAAAGEPAGRPLQRHVGGDIVALAFSPDGMRIVSGGYDRTVRLWDAATGEPLLDGLFKGHSDGVQSVAFSPDGTRIVSASWDNTLRLWDAHSGEPVGEPLRGHTNKVQHVAFGPDGQRIASIAQDGTLRLWSAVATGPLLGHAGWVNSVAFSPDGKRIFSGGGEGAVYRWDASSGLPIGGPMNDGQASVITSLALSPDGRRLVTGGDKGTVSMHDVETWSALGGGQAHGRQVSSIAFSRDGSLVASGSWDRTVRLWDGTTFRPRNPPLRGEYAIFGVAFCQDGKNIVSGSGDGTVVLWDVAAAKGVSHRDHEGVASSVAVSPDGRTIVSGGHDTTLWLRDAGTGAVRGKPLKGHLRQVTSVAFSPDGLYIVSGSEDTTLRLWDAATGALLGEPLEGHTDAVYSVAFSPDGTRIVSGGADGTVRLWRAPRSLGVVGAKAPDRLCAKLEANLSRAEWKTHVGDIPYVNQCSGLPVPSS